MGSKSRKNVFRVSVEGIGSRCLNLVWAGTTAVSTHFLGADSVRAVEATGLGPRPAPPEDIHDPAPAALGDVLAPKHALVLTIAA